MSANPHRETPPLRRAVNRHIAGNIAAASARTDNSGLVAFELIRLIIPLNASLPYSPIRAIHDFDSVEEDEGKFS